MAGREEMRAERGEVLSRRGSGGVEREVEGWKGGKHRGIEEQSWSICACVRQKSSLKILVSKPNV